MISDEGRGLFDLLDRNRDGGLGLRELEAAPKVLVEWDRDGDGQLAASEIPRSFQLVVGRGQVGLNRTLTSVVVASPTLMPATAVASSRAGPLWFRKMDRNHDGDVSRREFLGTSEQFQK